MKPKICLTMIVRNESRVIERCLKSMIPHIDSWAITDTGSDDDTIEIIERVLEGIPGKVYREPWVNFGVNRSIAFENSKAHGEYAFIIDADDVLMPDADFEWPETMGRSHYEMIVRSSGDHFHQARLLKTSLGWEWKGAVHEYPSLDESKADIPASTIMGLEVNSLPDGNRRMQDPVEKYRKDAALLEAELEENPGDTRALFYLAQSYRDCGDTEKAIEIYRKRALAGGWPEEAWYSQYQVGVLIERLSKENGTKDSWKKSTPEFLEAYRMRPSRIEPLVALSRNLRMRDEYKLAYIFISQVAYTPMPNDRLFIDSASYKWFALDEYAVCCYWLGMHKEALEANYKLLEVAPIREVPRIRENIRMSRASIAEKK